MLGYRLGRGEDTKSTPSLNTTSQQTPVTRSSAGVMTRSASADARRDWQPAAQPSVSMSTATPTVPASISAVAPTAVTSVGSTGIEVQEETDEDLMSNVIHGDRPLAFTGIGIYVVHAC